MARIIIKNSEYSLYDFDNEEEFEKAVIENKKFLFGKDTVYIDVKRLIGTNNHRGIPDAFLIDFIEPHNPQLYIVENEIASHDIYRHINEQIGRFSVSTLSPDKHLREILIKSIEDNKDIMMEIKSYLTQTSFETITELVLHLTESNKIKIAIAINEVTQEFNKTLEIYRNIPETVLLQRYLSGEDICYYYEPMRDEVEDIEIEKKSNPVSADFDTIVCSAFEDGFKHAYVENSAWWAIRLSQIAQNKLKYLAIYEKLPVAHIKHYAEVDKIEPYQNTNKYIIYLKNKKILENPIKLGNKKGEAPQSPRYTILSKLLSVKSIGELWH